MSDNFCMAPWVCLYLGRLYLKPCCLWSTRVNVWESLDDIKEMWHGEEMTKVRQTFLDGDMPNECRNCQNRIQPRNEWLNQRLGKYVNDEMFVLDPELKPLQIDFHLSNKCNLQCIMCASWATRNWAKDEKKLNEIDPSFNRTVVPNYELDVEKFKNAKEMFSKVVRFDFKGGEPMLHESMVEMLRNFVEWGYAPNMMVSYVTNASIVNEEAIDLWKYFKEVRLVVSVDGTDELFSYIRGFDFDVFEKNVKIYDSIPNVNGLHNVAISIYNILDIGTINDWMMGRDLERFPCEKSGGNYYYDCNVLFPTYLDVKILPPKYKKMALRKLEGHKYKNIDSFVMWLESIQNSPADEEQLKLFVKFTNEMDKRRGTNFLDLKPEFKELFEEYK